MNATSNLLLMFLPEALLGPLLVGLIVVGGLAMVLGFRRQGLALVVAAVAFPFVAVLVEATLNEVFAAIHPALVVPASMLLMLVVFLAMGGALIKAVFGQRAVDEAKGHLLADACRWTLRRIFSPRGLLLSAGVFGLLYVGVML